MEDNEQNQIWALQVLSMVDQGCMIHVVEFDVLLAVGYGEVWLDRDLFFFCELGNGTTGKQHVIKFKKFDARSNQVLFYGDDGELVAGLAPYAEWPEVNTDDMHIAWAEWRNDKAGLESCREAGREWRHARLSANGGH